MVETDVHYPTDVSLLWDAMRCVLRETGQAAVKQAVGGWRQWRHLSREVRKLFNKVRSTRRAMRHPERVEAYLERCRELVGRAVETLDALRAKGVEIGDHDETLDTLTRRAAPTLRAGFGIGPDSAAEMMIVAGDNPTRIRSDAAFAKLCGACPIPASSGVTNRHRLFRGGHRQANAALYRIVIVRMR